MITTFKVTMEDVYVDIVEIEHDRFTDPEILLGQELKACPIDTRSNTLDSSHTSWEEVITFQNGDLLTLKSNRNLVVALVQFDENSGQFEGLVIQPTNDLEKGKSYSHFLLGNFTKHRL